MIHLDDHLVVDDLRIGEDGRQVVDRPERESSPGRKEQLVPLRVGLVRHDFSYLKNKIGANERVHL